MKEKVDDCLTWASCKEHDLVYLKSKLLPVNIRLLTKSSDYSALIRSACELIIKRLKTDYCDYKKPHGMSGANCAVPFNIIAFFLNRSKDNKKIILMINPKILQYLKETEITDSNCGSIRLKNTIKVRRYKEVKVCWYDLNGKKYIQIFNRSNGSFTIQHEVDHNNGVLITDRNLELTSR